MKKCIKAITFVILTVTFFTTTSFKKPTGEWGNWISVNAAYSGIECRVRRGEYNPYARKYQWDVQFKNRYSRKVTFHYGMTALNESNNCELAQRHSLDANETDNNDNIHGFLINEVNSVHVCLGKVEFGN